MSPSPSRVRWPRVALGLLALAGVAFGGWYAFARPRPANGPPGRPDGVALSAPVVVEVVAPKPGGVQRVCVVPGTVEPFESQDLYAKVSGFLAELKVDIGSRVEKGQLLARIAVPEHEKAVERDEAKVRDAQAKVRQMEAHLKAAEAESRAAEAAVTLAKVTVRAKSAYRAYREKQLTRVRELAKQSAIEARVVDEEEDFFMSAVESENAAKEAVNSATERAAATKAKIDQAAADVDEAKAAVGVAQAELARSRVLLAYAEIRSEYTGVVTRRSFHVGEFVKSADQGGNTPILSVDRTDLMRVVVQVPDRDVPYVSLGDPAVVLIDALPGVVYKTAGDDRVEVRRWAEAEDPTTRTMRTEIDVKNPDGRLRRGMYGRVTLTLSEGTPNALRVPSAAVVGRAEGGRGVVRLVRDGKVKAVPVRFAADNETEVEVVSGLAADDRVIVRATGPLEEGAAVSVAGADDDDQ